jgi:glucose-1-phosphate thymidylyltransferase
MNTHSEIIGLIPAAGSGTRLHPYTGAKELLPIGSQSIEINGKQEERPRIVSQYVIESMVKAGAQKIIIIINQNKVDLMKLYKNGTQYGIDICYIFQEKPMGMAHALNLASNWLGNATVLMGMPDTVILPDTSFCQLLDYHENAKAVFSLGLYPTTKPQKFGMIKMNDSGDIVYHKDKPNKTDASLMWGIICWSPVFTKTLTTFIENHDAAGKEIVLGDIFDALIAEGKTCKGFPVKDGKYYDVGTYDDLKRAIAELK